MQLLNLLSGATIMKMMDIFLAAAHDWLANLFLEA